MPTEAPTLQYASSLDAPLGHLQQSVNSETRSCYAIHRQARGVGRAGGSGGREWGRELLRECEEEEEEEKEEEEKKKRSPKQTLLDHQIMASLPCTGASTHLSRLAIL